MAQPNKINLRLTYSLLGVFFILLALVVSFYFQYRATERDLNRIVQVDLVDSDVKIQEIDPNNWQTIYPNPKPIKIGKTDAQASVARTMSERITGLSGTPFLPEELVKLFIFDTPGLHSIWMKDMNYPLDIIWADSEGKIVYLEEDVSPDSFPNFFTPTVPAKYVIEANAGFIVKNGVLVGQMVILPNL